MEQTLSDLMKSYEDCYNLRFPVRTARIIRIDGKAFHTLTTKLNKPFDDVFICVMQQTMLDLCENIQGVQFGFVESDEISLLLYEPSLDTTPWFSNRLQKICSLSASMATLYFNKNLQTAVNELSKKGVDMSRFNTALYLGGLFDYRVFVIPDQSITPYFIWRQNDATRNSINGLGQKYFSSKELEGVKSADVQNKLLTEKGVNWNSLSTVKKRGTCAYKLPDKYILDKLNWTIDCDMPILTENKDFISNILNNSVPKQKEE